jgi:glycosyltransferase involved in cell wall biosynthesis
MVCSGWRMKPDYIQANDCNALPIGIVVGFLTGAKVIYDSHEYWKDTLSVRAMPKWMRSITRVTERVLAKKAFSVITVSDGIAEMIFADMGIKPYVVRNCPRLESMRGDGHMKRTSLHELCNIEHGEKIVLFQGAVTRDRGCEMLLDIWRDREIDAHLVFLGGGAKPPSFIANKYDMNDYVHWLDPVPSDVLLAYTSTATIGVHPISGNCINHQYCLPNKMLQYIHAGLPVVVSNQPEMRKIVCKYGVGECFIDNDAEDLKNTIRFVLDNEEVYDRYKRAAFDARKVLCWENEERELLRAYAMDGS